MRIHADSARAPGSGRKMKLFYDDLMQVLSLALLARNGRTCRVRSALRLKMTARGRSVSVRRRELGLIEFRTEPGAAYTLTAAVR